MDLPEKKELIVNSFRSSFDKDMAYQVVGMSVEEVEQLEQDEKFQARLNSLLISEKEKIITKLRSFMDSPDDRIAFQATTDLGKILYPEFFKRLNAPINVKMSRELTEEEEERIANEYGLLLGNKRVSKKSISSKAE